MQIGHFRIRKDGSCAAGQDPRCATVSLNGRLKILGGKANGHACHIFFGREDLLHGYSLGSW